MTGSAGGRAVKEWNRAIDAALKAVDAELELPGDPPAAVVAAMEAEGVIGTALAVTRVTKRNIRRRIEQLRQGQR